MGPRVAVIAEPGDERVEIEALARAAGLSVLPMADPRMEALGHLVQRGMVDAVLSYGDARYIEALRRKASVLGLIAFRSAKVERGVGAKRAARDASDLELLEAGADEVVDLRSREAGATLDGDATALGEAVARAMVRSRAVDQRLATRPRFRRHNVALALVAARLREQPDECLEAQVRTLTELAAEILVVGRTGVWLYDDARSSLRAFDTYDARAGVHKPGLVLERADYPEYFEALRDERTIPADDARAHPATRCFTEDYLEPHDIGAILDAPIRVRERVLGVLCHEHIGGPRSWTEEDQSIAAGIADFIALAFETHERKRVEASLRESQIALEQSRRVEAVGRLAGGVAHDFNNMLTVILSYAELLRRRLGDDHPLRPVADEIARAGHHAAEMTRKLLSVSRRDRLRPVVLDLGVTLREMERFLRQLIGEDVELELILPGAPVWVRADVGQLEQVFLNLAVNARDAMPTGGRLTIEVSIAGSMARLEVRDTGRGMAPDVQAHVFEPFFTTKDPGQGTGLGLFTVHGIVRDAGGTIDLESVAGRGTAIDIRFPLHSPVEALEASPVASSKLRGTETILFVEDEASVREVVSHMLRDLGYEVMVAEGGEAALQISREYRGVIDLLVADVVMPNLSGPALADRMLRQRPTMRVLFASGYAEDALRRYGERVAGAELLPKPFDRETLGKKVREVLSTTPPARQDRFAPSP
jgi:signal transduction histidine kinase/ActR/RegA family two-component response regulator